MEVKPHRPVHLPGYSEACLQALVERGLADRIVLGGAFGLLHYLDYRPTHDVDAWWAESATSDDRRLVVEAIEAALRVHGQVRHRAWGDVVSIELAVDGLKVFSFQIAQRTVQLAATDTLPWIDVPLDSLDDLLASKMVALVERGAPRDFRDIHAVCQAALTTPADCWRLWQRRERLANSDADTGRARLAIDTHMARITQQRPLERIADPKSRLDASRLREWFEHVFLAGSDGAISMD